MDENETDVKAGEVTETETLEHAWSQRAEYTYICVQKADQE